VRTHRDGRATILQGNHAVGDTVLARRDQLGEHATLSIQVGCEAWRATNFVGREPRTVRAFVNIVRIKIYLSTIARQMSSARTHECALYDHEPLFNRRRQRVQGLGRS